MSEQKTEYRAGGGEHWTAYNPTPQDNNLNYWVVGKGMRIVARCRHAEDCLLIVNEHNRAAGYADKEQAEEAESE